MSAKPCKRLCESHAICNSVTGRCVSKKGKIGAQILKRKSVDKSSRRIKKSGKIGAQMLKRKSADKSSRRMKKDKSQKIKRLVSPFKMLGPDVVRFGIKPFVEAKTCEQLATKFGCKGPMSVFTDEKGNRMDCAWQCMSNCNPSELMGIMNPPKTITFENDNGHKIMVNVERWDMTFSSENEIGEIFNPIDITQVRNNSTHVIFSGIYSDKTVPKIDAAKRLCKWFKKWAARQRKITVYANMGIEGTDHHSLWGFHIAAFDHPWIRPAKDWAIEWYSGRNGLLVALNIDFSRTEINNNFVPGKLEEKTEEEDSLPR